MGKVKRRKLDQKSNKHIRQHHYATHTRSAKPAPAAAAKSKKVAPSIQQPTIPFDSHDRILLVGEGDFSFAASLVTHHGGANVLATCFDSEEELLQKYPQAAANITTLLTAGQSVLYSVDATKLSQKQIRKGEKWDRVVFNFPHVGGKSTDVNRQVRYNQELLVSFFRSALPLLSLATTPSPASIILTLFEGEPYTLWNVRDLARHVGLRVGRSFRFHADAYPGYRHARTLGNIEGGGGWKGEGRSARTFVFERADGEAGVGKKRGEQEGKRRRREESDGEDDD